MNGQRAEEIVKIYQSRGVDVRITGDGVKFDVQRKYECTKCGTEVWLSDLDGGWHLCDDCQAKEDADRIAAASGRYTIRDEANEPEGELDEQFWHRDA